MGVSEVWEVMGCEDEGGKAGGGGHGGSRWFVCGWEGGGCSELICCNVYFVEYGIFV